MSDKKNPIYHTTSTLISASAGTGKTYQLASRYIALLMLGADPEKIIALTFTRKAAGEFRSRILHALAEGACGVTDPKTGRNTLAARIWEVWSGLSQNEKKEWVKASNSTPLLPATIAIVKYAASMQRYPEELYAAKDGKELRDYLKLPVQTAEEFAKILQKVVMVMSKLELSTIDSFFSKIVTGSSLELGYNNISSLDPTDEPQVRLSTIKDYLAARTVEEEKRQAFLDMFAELTGGKGTKTITKLESELQSHLALYRETPCADAWGNTQAFVAPGKPPIISLNRAGVDLWNQRAVELQQLLPEFTEKDFPRFIYSGLTKLATQDIPLSATMEKWLNAQDDTLDSAESTGIEHVIALAVWLRKYLPAKLMYAAQLRTRSLYSLLRDYADAYEQRIATTGELSFDDIARKAHKLMTAPSHEAQENNTAYSREHIALRTDKQYQHWMLDEFQDTSDHQFDTLAPVLEMVISDTEVPFTAEYPRPLPQVLQPYHEDAAYYVTKGSLFVVGDDKQGIYGFRTGETQAFEQLQLTKKWSTPIQQAPPLVKSYRSSPTIMGKDGFVNKLFRELHAIEETDEAGNNVDLIPFTNHDTAKNTAGYVEVQVIAKEEESAEDEEAGGAKVAAHKAVCGILHRLTIDDTTPINGMSIGILTRSNTEADALVNYLRNNMPNLPVLLVKDTLAATACPLGEILHHLFRWLLHPHDTTSCNILKASFTGSLFTPDMADHDCRNTLLSELETHGYAQFLHRILTLFPLSNLEEKQQRAHRVIMKTWLQTAHAFDAAGGNLATWVRRISTLSTQGVASSRYVQVMTMHKSKGLEFDAVILPFVSDRAIDSEKDLTYFRNPDGSGLLLSPGNSSIRNEYWPGIFERWTDAWKRRRCREDYNLLYVAVTRARYANYIICHGAKLLEVKTKKNGDVTEDWKAASRSIGGLIRRAWDGDLDECKQPYVLGTPMGSENWYDELTKKATVAPAISEPAPLGDALPRRKRLSPSSMAQHEDKPMREAEDTPAQAVFIGTGGTDFGSAVHECWEQITWITETMPKWVQAPQNKAQCIVATALQQPGVLALYTPTPGQEAYNEQPIECINDNNEWVSGTIDRLVITHDAGGTPVAAHIIDFKTNKLLPTETEPNVYKVLKNTYIGQMQAYKKLVCQALSLPMEAICVSLISCPRDGTPATVLTYADDELSR